MCLQNLFSRFAYDMYTFWRSTYESTRVPTFFRNSYTFGFSHVLGTKLNRFFWNVYFNNGSFQTTLILHISLQNLHVSFNWIHPSHINWPTQSDFSYKMNNQVYHNIKKDGGKNISSWHKITIISSSSSSHFWESISLLHMELKNEHSGVIVCLTFFGKIPRIATGSNCCIRTWQSCDFKPISFHHS